MSDKVLGFTSKSNHAPHNPVLFLHHISMYQTRNLELRITYNQAKSDQISCVFSRIARINTFRDLQSTIDPIYTLFYDDKKDDAFTIIPTLKGYGLRTPKNTVYNHQEKILAAFLVANSEFFKEKAPEIPQEIILTYNKTRLPTPDTQYLQELSEGLPKHPLDVIDTEGLRDAMEAVCTQFKTQR